MRWNLRNKKYHIKNAPCNKEEYFEKLKEFDTRSRSGIAKLKKEFDSLVAANAFHKENLNVNVVRSTGNYLDECKNCSDCFVIQESENCVNVFRGLKTKDAVDTSNFLIAEKTLMCILGERVYNSKYLANCINCHNLEYCDFCVNCENCFGCIGLKHKQYCILNKQYTKESFEKLRAKIKESMIKNGAWGEFFPYSMAPAGYNLSNSYLYAPKTKDEVIAMSGFWTEPDDSAIKGMPADQLPDKIDGAWDNITSQPLICPKTGYRYNIAPQELEFLKYLGIPLPAFHFDQRIFERFKFMTYVAPRQTSCFNCKKEITVYWPAELGYKKILCHDCYLKAE